MSKWSYDGSSYQRPLGDSEYAFFPASLTGTGDMFVYLALRGPRDAFREERVKIGWSIIHQRHPLLVSKVRVDGDDLTTARFLFVPPPTPNDALDTAGEVLQFKTESKDELIFKYMNGPRLLSNEHMSNLVISTPTPSPETDNSADGEYIIFICATHFIGDGPTLHQSTHDLLYLLTSAQTDEELKTELYKHQDWESILPLACEVPLHMPSSAFGKAACKVNFLQTLGREIGGHALPRTGYETHRSGVLQHAFSEAQTATILARCKANKVTINHVFAVLCNVAWCRCTSQSRELPMMMYSAINMRPPVPDPVSYWYLALTYFNLVLPSFAPSSHAIFWHRARLVRSQTHRVVHSPFLGARALQMASLRASRARGLPPPPPPIEPIAPKVPSIALLGLSNLGNLDRTYVRTAYPPSVQLRSLTGGTRLKPGGLLLLNYTWGNRLQFEMCLDETGFEEECMEKFWKELIASVEEFLC